MNNSEILAVREFRRFVNTHIYQNTVQNIMINIQNNCNSNNVTFNALPQPIIKFISGINDDNNNSSSYIELLHIILKSIFIDFFNNPDIIKLIRNKIYTEVVDEEKKRLLNLALLEIQVGNPRYTSLLFNITILKDRNVYIYL